PSAVEIGCGGTFNGYIADLGIFNGSLSRSQLRRICKYGVYPIEDDYDAGRCVAISGGSGGSGSSSSSSSSSSSDNDDATFSSIVKAPATPLLSSPSVSLHLSALRAGGSGASSDAALSVVVSENPEGSFLGKAMRADVVAECLSQGYRMHHGSATLGGDDESSGGSVVNGTSILDHLFIELDWTLTTRLSEAAEFVKKQKKTAGYGIRAMARELQLCHDRLSPYLFVRQRLVRFDYAEVAIPALPSSSASASCLVGVRLPTTASIAAAIAAAMISPVNANNGDDCIDPRILKCFKQPPTRATSRNGSSLDLSSSYAFGDDVILYDGRDGSLLIGNSKRPFAPTFGPGDVVGVGMDYHSDRLFFTLNGTWVG
ncbi:MAG: SPRY domain-containing protein, partial [Pseudomonadota bacterium]|nr:SPRY domain-containing protein [Pseudomonadota bacterium]